MDTHALGLAIAVAALVAAHFWCAWTAWVKLRRRPSDEVEMRDTRRERYFAESFRQKLLGWLRLPVTGGAPGEYSIIRKGQEEIRAATRGEYPDGSAAAEIVAVSGSFWCGRDCEFAREIYAGRDCQIGKRSRLQAVAADGRLALGPAVTVYRWADSEDELELRPGATVRGRATSNRAIHFGPGAEAGSLHAPQIRTQDARERLAVIDPAGERTPPSNAIEIAADQLPASAAEGGGFDLALSHPLGDEGILYRGDLHFEAPLHLRSKLVVRGAFSCPAGSVLEADVKATGEVSIGADSIVAGNLVAGGNLTLGERSLFRGVLRAEGELRLRSGVRGRRPDLAVAAYAAGRLYVETNVVVEGKLAAGERVVAVDPG